MKEQGKIPKMETMGDGARLSSRDYCIGRCKPCEEHPDGAKKKKVADVVKVLGRVLPALGMDCKAEYNIARAA
ncbi:unnamed protein product, partial [Ectocarpus sp. 4 AP-2014]